MGISHNYNGSNTYTYNTSNSGFWRSKVAGTPNSSGRSQINYYYYDSNNRRQTRRAESDGNARMYHVCIEASSGSYTLGRPRLDENGYTDDGTDNAQLVSPSFMIASRLGFVNTDNIDLSDERYALDVVREHCARYVEVYKDEKGETHVLDDWRLPTNAELGIIMKFQGEAGEDADAIDYLLNAEKYWSACEAVLNSKYSSSGTSVRCIRDAYDEPTDTKEADPAADAQ